HFHASIVIVAALLGALVCAAIATIPARRASRVAPVAAWRAAQPSAPRSIPMRLALLPVVIGAVGVTLLVVGVFATGASTGLDEAGALTIAVALLLALPVCMPRVLRVLSAFATRVGAAGSVAGTSATASPRRVIAPVLALVLGLGMVTTVAVLASSAHTAMRQLVSRSDKADFVVVSDSAPGIDVEALEKLAEAPSIRVVSEKGDDTFSQAGHTEQFTAVDTDTASLVFNLHVVSGTLAHFADGDIVLTSEAARQWHYRVGDYVPVHFGIPQLRYLRVSAIIADNGITRDWVIPFETYRRGYLSAPIRAAFIKGAPGTDHNTLERQVDVGVAGFPGVTVLDAATYAQSEAVKAEGPIALVQALVGLSIVVALLGVANALSLSVVERSWELGLLDVLGMTPAQVSLTVQWEAVFIAIAGIVFGVATGLVLGLGIAQGASVHGFTRLAVPFGTIAGVSVLVVVAAFVAAAIPARRAVGLSERASVARI
ncbi:MAG TPA: FtsX-like permease family protein, partial [Acidimicrobiia bacterium]